jgi:alpha-galactosidase
MKNKQLKEILMNKTLSALMGSLLMTLGAGEVVTTSAAINNLAKTPPMGWNSWNCFGANINETQIKQVADAMVSTGLKDAGYIYLNLDDHWMATSRDASGNLRGDPTRFSSGMKALGDYIHSKGLKFGIYGDRGSVTCYFRDNEPKSATKSGSKGFEVQDAKTFASWGVDYLKYDNCEIGYAAPAATMQSEYEKMRDALANSGRDIVFSICSWEFQPWMPNTGNLWRTTTDIINTWKKSSGDWSWGILDIIDLNEPRAPYAKPGAWNDPDMLMVGNYRNGGPTDEEYRSHFSLWCMMAAPLIMGNDIRNMKQVTKDILLNNEVIAVDQDTAGIQGTKIKSSNGLDVWCKPLGSKTGDTKAVALFNRNSSASDITVTFSDIGLSGEIHVRDLWAKTDKGKFNNSFKMNVPSHGTAMLKISSAPIVSVRKVNAKNISGISTNLSKGNIEFSVTGNNSAFSASIYTPDGQLVDRINNVTTTAIVPVKNSGVYFVDIRSNGGCEHRKVSVYR